MSHRRESGAVPPWVVPEPSPRKGTSHSEIQQKDTRNSTLSTGDRRVSGPDAAEEKRKSLASGDTHENQRFRSQKLTVLRCPFFAKSSPKHLINNLHSIHAELTLASCPIQMVDG
ncbi:hypothetical protein EG68_11008 [Paragonimus skrjabini miyazakii]|uniref:Uncharacterized protein n=1 Tax=Paragonimus skrjabini miyazakii TaxID=59628 RepID=A0A8S9YJE3_9TREM|nr:hypothetical protein EG68_11008 [Paragonimus skrjabini miyazakii]